MGFGRNKSTYFHRLPSASSLYHLPIQNTKRPSILPVYNVLLLLYFSFSSETFLPARPNVPPAQDCNNNNNALGGGGLGDFMAWKKRDTVSPRELMAHGFLFHPSVFIFNA
jgi:hypothetical protein